MQQDIYFSPFLCPFFGGDINNEALRIRVLDEKNILNYKNLLIKLKMLILIVLSMKWK